MLLAVARFEVALQRREFLTWLYLAIFFLLCFGYLASGAVELVSDRDGAPKHAPWAIAHAMAGVTAFGQLITAMIAATAVMRDVAMRSQELLFTTRLTHGAYLGGRFLGALLVMGVVYASIPAGLLTAAATPWSGAPFASTLHAVVRPFAVLVVPNVFVAATLFFVSGALGRGFMAILLSGLALIAAWQTGLSLVDGGRAWAGALLDPFGNAALAAATQGWSVAMKSVDAMPLAPYIAANRLLWFLAALGSLGLLAQRYRFRLHAAARSGGDARTAGHDRAHTPVAVRAAPSPRRELRRAAEPLSFVVRTPTFGRLNAFRTDFFWTLRWTLKERGFVTLVALAVLNALMNALSVDSGLTPFAVVAEIREHSRVLLIILVTIYAGELVWRDRELRVDELRDALPLFPVPHVVGRLSGLLVALGVVALALSVSAGFVGALRHAPSPLLVAARTLLLAFGFATQFFLFALLVHVIVQHKVAGHVLLITGWLVAIVLDRNWQIAPLWRYSDLAADLPIARLLWGELYFTSCAGIAGLAAILLWQRGAPARWRDRFRVAAVRSRRRVIVAAGILGALAIIAGHSFG